MKPVGVMDFLNDDRVLDIIGGKEGGQGEVVYKHPSDFKPVLMINGEELDVSKMVTVPMGGRILIDVKDIIDNYGGLIEWFYYDDSRDIFYSQGKSNVVSVDTAEDPFKEKGIYHIVVVGIEKESDLPYSTVIIIRID